MAASAEVDALPALCDAPGVSRCEVDYSLLRGLWQQDRADATSARTAASFSSAHRPRPPHITTNRSRVRGGTRICDDRMRSVLRKCALGSRWQESCLSSAAPKSLKGFAVTPERSARQRKRRNAEVRFRYVDVVLVLQGTPERCMSGWSLVR